MKERLTITLEEDTIKELDSFLERAAGLKNRSQGIQYLIDKGLQTQKPTKAVILCGGKGTKFGPISKEMPKALLPVQGRPVAEHLIHLFKKYGVNEIYLSVGHLKEKIMEHFGDGSKFGVNIKYIEEAEPLGTAGWMYLAKHLFTDETIFVTNGDELKDIDLNALFQTHQRNNANVTIALTTVNDVSRYGVAELSGSRILQFVASSKNPPSRFINSGLYVISPEVFMMAKPQVMSFEKDVFPVVAAKGKLFGHAFSGQWFDLENSEQYEIALKRWKGI